jgi:hypothetical protein
MKFSFFNSDLDFGDAKVECALSALNSVKDVLKHCTYDGVYNYKYRIPYLKEIEAAIKVKNSDLLKKLVINSELIGGSGALWEIHINEENYKKEFDKYFFDF